MAGRQQLDFGHLDCGNLLPLFPFSLLAKVAAQSAIALAILVGPTRKDRRINICPVVTVQLDPGQLAWPVKQIARLDCVACFPFVIVRGPPKAARER